MSSRSVCYLYWYEHALNKSLPFLVVHLICLPNYSWRKDKHPLVTNRPPCVCTVIADVFMSISLNRLVLVRLCSLTCFRVRRSTYPTVTGRRHCCWRRRGWTGAVWRYWTDPERAYVPEIMSRVTSSTSPSGVAAFLMLKIFGSCQWSKYVAPDRWPPTPFS